MTLYGLYDQKANGQYWYLGCKRSFEENEDEWVIKIWFITLYSPQQCFSTIQNEKIILMNIFMLFSVTADFSVHFSSRRQK